MSGIYTHIWTRALSMYIHTVHIVGKEKEKNKNEPFVLLFVLSGSALQSQEDMTFMLAAVFT